MAIASAAPAHRVPSRAQKAHRGRVAQYSATGLPRQSLVSAELDVRAPHVHALARSRVTTAADRPLPASLAAVRLLQRALAASEASPTYVQRRCHLRWTVRARQPLKLRPGRPNRCAWRAPRGALLHNRRARVALHGARPQFQPGDAIGSARLVASPRRLQPRLGSGRNQIRTMQWRMLRGRGRASLRADVSNRRVRVTRGLGIRP